VGEAVAAVDPRRARKRPKTNPADPSEVRERGAPGWVGIAAALAHGARASMAKPAAKKNVVGRRTVVRTPGFGRSSAGGAARIKVDGAARIAGNAVALEAAGGSPRCWDATSRRVALTCSTQMAARCARSCRADREKMPEGGTCAVIAAQIGRAAASGKKDALTAEYAVSAVARKLQEVGRLIRGNGAKISSPASTAAINHARFEGGGVRLQTPS